MQKMLPCNRLLSPGNRMDDSVDVHRIPSQSTISLHIELALNVFSAS